MDILAVCDVCGSNHATEECPVLEMPVSLAPSLSRARLTVPHFASVAEREDGSLSVVAMETIQARTRIGPFEAKRVLADNNLRKNFPLKIFTKDGSSVSLDTGNEHECNWLALIRRAEAAESQNLMAMQIGVDIYYTAIRDIAVGEELSVWYAPYYAQKLHQPPYPGPISQGEKEEPVVIKTEVVSVNYNPPSPPPQPLPTDDLVSLGQPNPSFHQALEVLTQPRNIRIKHRADDEGLHTCSRCSKCFEGLQELACHVKEHLIENDMEKGRLVVKRRAVEEKKSIMAEQESAKALTSIPNFDGENADQDSTLLVLVDDWVDAAKKNCDTPRSMKWKSSKSNRKLDTAESQPSKTKSKVAISSPEDDIKSLGQRIGKTNIVNDDDDDSDSRPRRTNATSVKDNSTNRKYKKRKPQILDNVSDGICEPHDVRRSSRSVPKKFSVIEVLGLKHDKNKALKEVPFYTKKEKKEKSVKSKQSGSLAIKTKDKYQVSEKSTPKRRKLAVTADDEKPDELLCAQSPKEGNRETMLSEESPEASARQCITKTPQNALTSTEINLKGLSPNDISIEQAVISPTTIINEAHKQDLPPIIDPADIDLALAHTSMDSENKGMVESTSMSHENTFKSITGRITDCNQTPDLEQEASLAGCHRDTEERTGITLQHDTEVDGEFAGTEAESKTETASEVKAPTFTCKECDKVFLKEVYLQRHLEVHESSYACSECKRKFGRKTSLLRHHCTVEHGENSGDKTEEGPFFCEFCGAKFSVEKYLARHMATHTGEFSCSKCSRVYARKQSLLAHLKKCDPEQLKERGLSAHVCEVCNRAFSKEISLRNHMTLHTDKFCCETCGKSFTSSVSMTRHKCNGVSVLQSSDPICCDFCPQKFKSQYFLKRHMAKHEGTFSCPTCHRSYITVKEFKKHILECQAQSQAGESGQVVCGVCEAVIDGPQAFRKHFEQHTHPYHCQKCGKGFMRRANLQNHVCKEEEGPVSCSVCNKEFRLAKYLQNHMLVHEEKKFHCEHCNKAYRQITQYNKHLCVDPNGKPAFIFRLENNTVRFYEHDTTHICQLCGKNFTTVSNLNKHIKCHGEKTETCDICNKKFHLKIQVKLHKRMVHTKVSQYECQYCHKMMKSRNSLYGHIAAYHGEVVQLFQCKECGKRFRHKGNLTKHALLHSDKKLYSCNQCNKTFKYPEQRRRHELWHQHGHRFKCALCSRSFLMEFELKRHVNSFHGGVLYRCKYCSTECHHAHTMKRHLQRRHMDVPEWQSNTIRFLKSIARENADILRQATISEGIQVMVDEFPISPGDNNIAVDQGVEALREFTEKEDLGVDEHSAAINGPALDASLLENLNLMNETSPLIVAEVQGMNGQEMGTTQTVIIQTMGDHLNEDNFVSEEVAMALRNLGMQGFMVEGVEDQAASDAITTISNEMVCAQTDSMGNITLVPMAAADEQTHLTVQLE